MALLSCQNPVNAVQSLFFFLFKCLQAKVEADGEEEPGEGAFGLGESLLQGQGLVSAVYSLSFSSVSAGDFLPFGRMKEKFTSL